MVVLLAAILIPVILLSPVAADTPEPQGAVLWESPQHASTTSYNGAFIPILKADSDGRLLLAYNNKFGSGIENPYFRESKDGGNSWSDPAPIHDDRSKIANQVDFAFDNEDVAHAIWRTDKEIRHARYGQWPNGSNRVILANDIVFSPDIAVAPNDTLHIVWAQSNTVYHVYSKDKGTSWSSPKPVAVGPDKTAVPTMAIDHKGDVHVVWEQRVPNTDWKPGEKLFFYEIRYKKGIASKSGVDWSGRYKLLSKGILESRAPTILALGDDIHVAFARRETDDEQYAYIRSFSPATGWSILKNVTQGDPVAMNTTIPFVLVPSLDNCDDTLYIYFHGAIASNMMERIWGVNSSNGWSFREPITDDVARDIRPSMVCVGGTMHIAYEQILKPNENHQIYYMAGKANSVFLPIVYGN